MAWDEWEQLKADALGRQPQMRLNGTAPNGGPSGKPDLRSNKPGANVALRALQEDIRPGTDKAGSHAEETSSAAVREFQGWATGSGLKDAHDEWRRQVKSLQGRLGRDQSALQGSHRNLQQVDFGIESGISALDLGPNPRREV